MALPREPSCKYARREPESRTGHAGKHSKRMRRLSQALRANHPFCEVCTVRPGVEVHHVVKWADSEALRVDPANLVICCRDCHEALEKGAIAPPCRG